MWTDWMESMRSSDCLRAPGFSMNAWMWVMSPQKRPHYGEGMGEECLCVGVGHLPAGVSVDAVHVNGGAVKSYLCHGVNLLADAAVSYDLVSLASGFGEVVVEVAAEVEVLLCGVVYHCAGSVMLSEIGFSTRTWLCVDELP